MQWLRRSFLTGLVVTVPLFITVVTLVWTFRFIDGVARPASMYFLGREVPGLGVLTTAAFILFAGASRQGSAGACCSAARGGC